MRRTRAKLQVSTFPFLAVLLGAMGSLIFLLLVMDRRAKIVARNKVAEARQARLTASTEIERKNQEEWERQRRQLHDALAAQEQELREQLQNLAASGKEKSVTLEQQSAARQELEERIALEESQLRRDQEALNERRNVLARSARLEETSKAELAKLTRDLVEMEQTLAGLKRLKNQQPPSYSLVPYRGQRGESRIPIYVECTRAGLVFLPDRLSLTGEELDITRFRAEVERRHGPLVKEVRSADPFHAPALSEEPYVLFLVRPDGIVSYYRGQAALRGFQIDYGYELVDGDWTLEVPSPAALKYLAQQSPAKGTFAISQRPGLPGSALPGDGSRQPAGQETRPEARTDGFGTGSIRSGGPGVGTLPPRPASAAPGLLTSGTTSGGKEPMISSAGSASLPGPPRFGPPGSESPMPGPPRNDRPSGAAGSVVGAATASPVAPQSVAFRGAASAPATSVLDGPTPGIKVPGAVARENPTTPPGAAGIERSGNGESAAHPSGAATPGNGTAPSGVTSSQGEAGTPEPGSPFARLAPASPRAEKQPRSGPVSLGRVIGNRDFLITLACYEQGVQVTPGGATFAWPKPNEGRQVDDALVRTVTQLVQRRQATVSAGEPPYRPVLRFEVHERGRRTYYHVYPLLENLRFAMIREDLEE